MSHVKNVQKEAAVALPTAGETYVAEDGTVSHVLEDVIDENYEPTQEEILEYAEWMGMTLPEDNDLLWIAREGLKTPLPKEWKPCKTDDDEVYYFNFRTGESSWFHPMDNIMRKKYETEKAKRQQAKKKVVGKSNPNTPSSAAAASLGVGGTSAKAGGTTTTTAHPTNTLAAGGKASLSTSQRTTSPNEVGLAPGGLLGIPSAFHSAPPTTQPARIVSEAERKLEEQIRQEAAKAFEEEKTKLEQLRESKLAALRKVLDKDRAEAKAADDARRAEGNSGFEEQRRRRIEETRAKCDAKFGAQLRELERQAESAQQELDKLTAEKERMTSQAGGERAKVEKEAAEALRSELARVEQEVAEAKRKKLNLASSAFTTQKAAVEKAVEEATRTARAEMESEYRRKEVSAAMAMESRRKKLEATRRDLELDVRNAKRAAPSSGALSSPSSPSSAGTKAGGASGGVTTSPAAASEEEVRKRLAAIEAKRDATCLEIRSQAAKEQAALRKEKEAQMAALRKAIAEAKEKAASSGSPTSPSTAVSRANESAGMTFHQRMIALRSRANKEKLETMARLKQKRETRLAEAKSSAASTPLRTPTVAEGGGLTPNRGSGISFDTTTPELSAEDAAKVEERAAYYKAIEAQWMAETERNLAAAVANPQDTEAAVEAAVAADIAAFTKKLAARRERERVALEEKAAKMREEHAAALKAYEERKADAERRRQEEAEETKAAMMAEAVAAAVAKESAALQQDMEAAKARRLASYTREEDAVKAAVDEEMAAYERAEMKRVEDAAAAMAASKAKAIKANTRTDRAAPAPSVDHTEAIARLDAEAARLNSELASLKTRRQDMEAQQAAAVAAAEQELAAKMAEQQRLERTLRSAMVAPTNPAPAVAATLPARTVTKLVPPPNSVPKAMHKARMVALEESYRAQETALREELRAAMASAPSTATAVHTDPHQPTAFTPQPEAAGPSLVVSGSTPRTFSTSDALHLLRSQEEALRRRQEALADAREGWARTRGGYPYDGEGSLMVYEPQNRTASRQGSLPPTTVYARNVSSTSGLPPSPEPQQLVAAMESLNRTLEALSGRVAHLETSVEPMSTSRARNTTREESRLGSLGRDHVTLSRGHPSGLPSSPLRAGERAASVEADMRNKWDHQLRSYQAARSRA